MIEEEIKISELEAVSSANITGSTINFDNNTITNLPGENFSLMLMGG